MNADFIDYRDNKGFYISNIFMQLLIHYINEELKKSQHIFTNKNKFLYDNESIISGVRAGYFALTWDSTIVNSTEEQTMIQILQTVKTTLQNKGAFISVSELQGIPTSDEDFKIFYRDPFPTAELIKISDALIQMLQGTWTYTNYGMKINYKY
jgi:hypothetical protein